MNTVLDFRQSPPVLLVRDTTRIVFDRQASIAVQLSAVELHFEAADVWLDFEDIETVNSAELSALIRFVLQLRRLEKTVSICNVGPHLEELFAITRFGAWTIS